MADFIGTNGDDKLIGTDQEDYLEGQGGRDVLYGKGGDDSLHGDDGNDQLYGGFGNDWLIGGAGNDVLYGNEGNDTLYDRAGNDKFFGGDGDDVMVGGIGATMFDGGNGGDTVLYDGDEGVWVDLGANIGFGGEATGDHFSSIEGICGTNSDDVLIGNATTSTYFDGEKGSDILIGGSGNDFFRGIPDEHVLPDRDTITGGGGADHIDGGNDFDTAMYDTSAAAVRINLATGWGSGGDAQGDQLISIERVLGSKFDDTLIGTSGADTLDGGMGNDHIVGGAGADTLIGGAGSDWLDYSSSSAGVAVGLSTGYAAFGDAAGDMFSGFENIDGSAFGDHLRGDGGANQLVGYAGNDILSGLAGNDELIGGLGQDTMTGGLGTDRFQFLAASDSSKSIFTEDVITDFNHAQGDQIDLGLVDANANLRGNQSFSFIGGAAFTAEGQIRAYQSSGDTYVELNTSGTSGIDMGIKLSGVHDLVSNDFVL